ncbi:antiterminator Q family protein [Mixta calida]|uniref:antiterminator Q family protein n=1 Tax=Mixta calida TaxID=665913 RepID=UPI0034D6F997
MHDIYDVLGRWGAWAALDNSILGWHTIAAGFKGIVTPPKRSRLQCDDDTGLLVDEVVLILKRYNNEGYELIIAHFVMDISLRKIAKKLKCSDGTIRKQLSLAVGFVEGALALRSTLTKD